VVTGEDSARAAVLLPRVEHFPWPAVGWGTVGYVWQGPTRAWVGSLLGVLERWGEAVTVLEDALTTAELGGARPIAAHLCCELARALLGRGLPGDAARAVELLDAAAAEAAALEMPHQAARIAQLRGGLEPGLPCNPRSATRSPRSSW
jgi:hypothetical protein